MTNHPNLGVKAQMSDGARPSVGSPRFVSNLPSDTLGNFGKGLILASSLSLLNGKIWLIFANSYKLRSWRGDSVLYFSSS